MDFTTTNPEQEQTPEGANEMYERDTHSTWAQRMAQAPEEGPLAKIAIYGERGAAVGKNDSGFWFSRYVDGLTKSDFGNEGAIVPSDQLQPEPELSDAPALPADVINKRYAPAGTTITDQPMTEALARVIGRQKGEEMDREGVLERFSSAHSWPVNFATELAASMMDPLNAVSMFVPGVGEEQLLARATAIGLGEGVLARTAARVGAEATAVGASQAPLIALKYGAGQEQNSDYNLRSAFLELAYGIAGGALMGGARSGFRELGPWPDHLMQAQAEAIANADALTKHAAASTSIAQVVRGEPIDVTPIFDVHAAQAAETELGSWVRQRQRIDLEGAQALAEADRLGSRADAASLRAKALEDQLLDLRVQQESFERDIAPVRTEIEGSTAEQAARQTAEAQGTEIAAQRLAAVDTELASVIPAARREDLIAERRMLTEGAADVSPESDQALATARAQAQLQGLQIGAARVGPAADKTETALAGARAKAEAAARTADRTFAVKAAVVQSKERIVEAMASRSIRRYAGRIGAVLGDGEADRLGADVTRGRADIKDVLGDLNKRATGNPYFIPETDPSTSMAAEGVQSVRSVVGSPADLAERLKRQEVDGYSPGMSTDEYKAADQAIYGVKEPVTAPKTGEIMTEAERTAMLAREQDLLNDPNLTPESRAELDAAEAEMQRASSLKEAYEQAGACLTGAGI